MLTSSVRFPPEIVFYFFTSAYGVAFHQTAAVQLAFFVVVVSTINCLIDLFLSSVPLVSNKVTQTKQCSKIKPPLSAIIHH